MSLNRKSIQSLLDELATSSQFRRKGLKSRPLDQATFEEPAPGYAIWLWGQVEPGDLLKLTFVFNDLDGVAVFLSIVAAPDNYVREIELWRGDGGRIQHLPSLPDLSEPESGKVY